MTSSAHKLFVRNMRGMTTVTYKKYGADFEVSNALMQFYPEIAVEAIQQMTLIACKQNPEAFCQYVVQKSCSKFLLDPANDSQIFSGGKLSTMGSTILSIFKKTLDDTTKGPGTPGAQHNAMQLKFVEDNLKKRMK